jgi:GxxExxY protein
MSDWGLFPMNSVGEKLKYADITEKIIGVYFSVYNELGFGFLESVYQSAMEVALTEQGFDVGQQVAIPVWFHNRQIGDYRADLVVDGCVLLELKAAKSLESAHEAQLLNYLRATQFEVGLLLNFGPKPEFKRMVFDNTRKRNIPKETEIV